LFEFAFVNALVGAGKAIGAIVNLVGSGVERIKSFVNSARDAINNLIELYNSIPVLPNITRRVSDDGVGGFNTGPGFVNLAPQGGFGSLTVSAPSTGYQRADQPIYINVNAPSAIDEDGFSRAVINALNNVERRSGGGASQFVGLTV